MRLYFLKLQNLHHLQHFNLHHILLHHLHNPMKMMILKIFKKCFRKCSKRMKKKMKTVYDYEAKEQKKQKEETLRLFWFWRFSNLKIWKKNKFSETFWNPDANVSWTRFINLRALWWKRQSIIVGTGEKILVNIFKTVRLSRFFEVKSQTHWLRGWKISLNVIWKIVEKILDKL